ncbi:hypothetical protein GCM10010470_42620 [Saccharopolyspora taberi]|uniref:Uncharacterized protein n=1 Tax=Saccharopolyspora taberi TaxID=60895 RepID=A0ABN3VGG7_9PSEU
MVPLREPVAVLRRRHDRDQTAAVVKHRTREQSVRSISEATQAHEVFRRYPSDLGAKGFIDELLRPQRQPAVP